MAIGSNPVSDTYDYSDCTFNKFKDFWNLVLCHENWVLHLKVKTTSEFYHKKEGWRKHAIQLVPRMCMACSYGKKHMLRCILSPIVCALGRKTTILGLAHILIPNFIQQILNVRMINRISWSMQIVIRNIVWIGC